MATRKKTPVPPPELTAQDALLVRALAGMDSLYWPISKRGWDDLKCHWRPNRYFARKRLAATGLPMRSEAGTGSERKAHTRLLDDAAEAGLLKLNRGGGSGFPNVRLTDLGEAHARQLANAGGEYSALLTLEKLFRITGGPRIVFAQVTTPSWPWTCLSSLASSITPDAGEVDAIIIMAMHGLVRGWMELESDGDGRPMFRITDIGGDVIVKLCDDTGGVIPEPEDVMPHPVAQALYVASVDAAIAAMETAEPERPGEIGFIPRRTAPRLVIGGPVPAPY
jgi:hypothetical protein